MAQQQWLTFDEGVAAQAEALDQATPDIIAWLETGAADHLSGSSLLLAGIGASYAAAATPVYAAREAGIQAFRSTCSDVPDDGTVLADAYIAVSQGGQSRETIQALLTVPKEQRVAVVNASESPLASTAGTVLSLGDLTDSRMSSIGFSATVVALGLLVDRLAGRPVHESWSTLGATSAAVVAEHEEALREFGRVIAERGTVDVVAAAPDLTSAEQGALLFREGPGLPAMAMDTRSYLHGPMDCAGPSTSHVLIGRARE